MGSIKTIYVCNHSHTDIGFTDYQDVCFRQHGEFIGQALDLIEATDGYPAEAQYSWTCETTGPLLRYLRGASQAEIDRFRHWHEDGRIDVAAMQYNLTPLLNIEQMHRIALSAPGAPRRVRPDGRVGDAGRRQRRLLALRRPPRRPRRLVLHRGDQSDPRGAAASRSRAPSGGRGRAARKCSPGTATTTSSAAARRASAIATWSIGCCRAGSTELEADASYPYDFLYCEFDPSGARRQRPARPAHARLREALERRGAARTSSSSSPPPSSASCCAKRARQCHRPPARRLDRPLDRRPRLERLRDRRQPGDPRNRRRGESDRRLDRARGADGWDAGRAAYTYENATLFDEHTWGAYSSVEAPQSLFTRAQWNRKAGYAYTAAMEAHDQLARAANALAKPLGTRGPEGIFNLGDLKPEEAFKPSGIDEVLVINTLPWERQVIVEEPEPRGGAAPVGVLDCFFNRGSGWGGARPIPPIRRVAGTVPAMGYAFLRIAEPDSSDLAVSPGVIENRHYRVRVDPAGGGLLEFFDKALEHDFAGTYQGWRPGPVRLRDGRFQRRPARHRQHRLLPSRLLRRQQEHPVAPPDRRQGRDRCRRRSKRVAPRSRVRIDAPGVSSASVTYALDAGTKSLAIDWTLDKLHHEDPEAVFVAFPFKLDEPRFTIDLNGIPSAPNDDQLDGAAKDWYPLQRWVDVSDGKRGVTLVPLDAPLVHLGGITTGKWARTLEPEGPTIMSWALNNHWLVNFKAEPGRPHPAPLPADHARRPGRSGRRGALCGRSLGAADRAPRHRADRRAERLLLQRRSGIAGPGHRQAGRGRRLDRASPAEPVADRKPALLSASPRHRPRRDGAIRSSTRATRSASTAASSASIWSRSRLRRCSCASHRDRHHQGRKTQDEHAKENRTGGDIAGHAGDAGARRQRRLLS